MIKPRTRILILISFLFLALSLVSEPANGNHFGPVKEVSNIYTGSGNSTNPINKFDPNNMEIYETQTIRWTNPTAGKPYPHMVTFIGNQSTPLFKSTILNVSSILQTTDLPFDFQELTNNLNKLNNDSMAKNHDHTQAFDAISVMDPSVIGASKANLSILKPYDIGSATVATYNMTGNEKYLNSGLIWNGRMIPNGFQNLTAFDVMFINPGTYHYQCLLYPGMNGTVIVKPSPNEILGIRIK